MRKFQYGVWILLFGLSLGACAHRQVEDEVNREVAAQPSRPMDGGVAYKGLEAIESSRLSDDQKNQFRELQTRMMVETAQNRDDTSKLKGVLFETLASPQYDRSKVEEIKRRLVKLNQARMENMFRALEEVQKIVGYLPPRERQEAMGSILRDEPFSR